jgi:hypothetical protein
MMSIRILKASRLLLLVGFWLASLLVAHAQIPGGGTGGPPAPLPDIPGNGTTGGPPAPAPVSSAPLPVELVGFTADAQGDDALLQWATASEKNNDRFEVEASPDGRTFRRIGQVAGHGSSTQAHKYQLVDPAIARHGTGLVYYRLRQVDADGTFAYSPVRTVAVRGLAGLALFPNPTRRAATLTGAAPGSAVLVFDAVGRRVLALPADAAGTAPLALPDGFATGVYVVRTGSTALRLTVE